MAEAPSAARVRQLPKARRLQVLRVLDLTPSLRRITLGGEDLADFSSLGFDDHVKLILAEPAVPGEGRPLMRDYTPRRFDAEARELDIEFAMHGDGPADRFARTATVGQALTVAGPRGSFVTPLDFDWHWLVGDESALPAMARRLEELPADAQVTVVAQVAGMAHQLVMQAPAATRFVWLHLDQPQRQSLADAVAELPQPAGHGFAWAAGEASEMAAVRRELVGHHGLDKRQVKVAAYWKRGAVAHHEKLGD